MTLSPPPDLPPRDIDWNDLRIFLEVARSGSFSRASHKLNTHQSTVSRRISLLEHQLGGLLAVRTPQGILLTGEGQVLLAQAERMESMLFDLRRQVNAGSRGLTGKVVIGSTDGFGVFWITPRLTRFHQMNPDIQVELVCSEQDPRLDRLEADIVLKLGWETAESHTRSEMLGPMPFGFYAAPSYLDRAGHPRTAEDLSLPQHRLVVHDYYPSDGLWAPWSRLVAMSGKAVYRTNSSAALVAACRSGLGIALLSDYAREVLPDLVRLPVFWDLPSLPVTLVSHADTARSARVESMVSFLRAEYRLWASQTDVLRDFGSSF
jgi:DNA-binding transcriptional LysR family regulator